MVSLEISILLFLLELNFRLSYGGLFPVNSGMGIFAAVAVPLDIPDRNVFLSVNFEANYNLPTQYTDAIPGPLSQFENLAEDGARNLNYFKHLENSSGLYQENYNSNKKTNFTNKRSTKQFLITRANVYDMFEKKLESFGYPGNSCLLKVICEVNESTISENNGVLGSFLHIIFSPSTSETENISEEYYEAEIDGENLECDKYNAKCPYDMIDIISVHYKAKNK